MDEQMSEVTQAMIALGYSPSEALRAVKETQDPSASDTGAWLKRALGAALRG